jgi:hypothetical protein
VYYPQQPPPGYPSPYYGPRYSGCLKFVLYALSFLIPIVGIVVGVIYMSRGDPESKSLGQVCLVLGIVSIVLGCCIGGVVSLLPVITEGMSSY